MASVCSSEHQTSGLCQVGLDAGGGALPPQPGGGGARPVSTCVFCGLEHAHPRTGGSRALSYAFVARTCIGHFT